MSIKGKLKDKIMIIVFLILSVGIASSIYIHASDTRQTIYVPVLNKDVSEAYLVTDDDITMKEIGAFNVDHNLVLDKNQIVGTYFIKEAVKNRLIYKDQITDQKPKTDIKHLMKYGAIAVKTNITKCVGGMPKVNDYVSISIINKNDNNEYIVEEPEVLEHIKIISIKYKNGSIAINGDKNEPTQVIFDANEEQRKRLLQAEYGGQIHLTLLPYSLQQEKER